MDSPPVFNASPKRKGVLPAARPAIEKLLNAGMYLSGKIIDQALALVDE